MAKAPDMPEESDGRTVQMSAEQLQRLHRELGLLPEAPAEAPAPAKAAPAKAAAPKGGVSRTALTEEPPAVEAEPAYEEPAYEEPAPEAAYEEPAYEEPAYEEPAPEPVPAAKPAKAAKAAPAPKPAKAEKPAPAPKPAKAPKAGPAPAENVEYADGGGALCILGGVGAIVVTLLQVLALLPLLEVNLGLDPELALILLVGGGIGAHLLLFFGMLGAARPTNGLASLVGIFHLLTALLLAFNLIAPLAGLEVSGDLREIMMLLFFILPATTFLVSGLWGFAAGRGMGGALAAIYGTLAFLAGGAALAVTIMGLTRSLDPDLGAILAITSTAALALAGIVLAIAMFGPLRRGPAAEA